MIQVLPVKVERAKNQAERNVTDSPLPVQPAKRAAVGGPVQKIFLLSPAKVSGVRAGLLLNPLAPFPLARKFRRRGLSLAEVFTFASGLYFRGKIAYARRFADPENGDVLRVITTNAGLLDPDTRLTPRMLRAFGTVDIHEADERFHRPLTRDAQALAAALADDGLAVLLGSIATAKYRDVLLATFGERLAFPTDFVGRGDMSRGALMLRAAASGDELSYEAVRGALFKGKRAPRVAEMERTVEKRSAQNAAARRRRSS